MVTGRIGRRPDGMRRAKDGATIRSRVASTRAERCKGHPCPPVAIRPNAKSNVMLPGRKAAWPPVTHPQVKPQVSRRLPGTAEKCYSCYGAGGYLKEARRQDRKSL
jgi:hypothetical protein